MKSALMLFVFQTASACIPVAGDRILGSHLVLADATLAVFPPTVSIALAPSPGSRQVVTAGELIRLAKSQGVSLNSIPTDVCFEFSMRQVRAEDALEAMRRTLPSGANAEIVELPSAELPVGDLHFPLSTLEPGSDIQTWRGYVQYTPTRRAPFSMKVRLQSGLKELVLTRDVAPGVTFSQEMFRSEPVTGLAIRAQVATRPEQVIGTTAKVPLKTGQRIPLNAFEQPPAVRKGDIVSVEVRSGSARIQLDAIAQRTARDGEIMDFLNPLSGKTFKARLEGNRAIITVGGRL